MTEAERIDALIVASSEEIDARLTETFSPLAPESVYGDEDDDE